MHGTRGHLCNLCLPFAMPASVCAGKSVKYVMSLFQRLPFFGKLRAVCGDMTWIQIQHKLLRFRERLERRLPSWIERKGQVATEHDV
jgi:hypothetical protein